MSSAYHHRAFTLVELAVVLVILGLLVGAILVSRNLYDTGQRQAQIAQTESFSAMVASFKTAFNGLPGDLPNGTTLAVQNENGNGNGRIDIDNDEHRHVFNALSLGGFTTRSYAVSDFPNAILGNEQVIAGNHRSVVDASSEPPPYNYWMVSVDESDLVGTSLTAEEAYKIDLAVDDGLPQTGNITVFDLSEWDDPNYYDTPSNDDNCTTGGWVPDTTIAYLKTNTVRACPIFVRIKDGGS